MVLDLVVANASPLILLGKARQLELLWSLAGTIVVPAQVADEVRRGRLETEQALDLASVRNARIQTSQPVPASVVAWDLGAGESQVLSIAAVSSGSVALLDDLQGRRCAAAHGIRVIGTLGIVLFAKRQGRIATARPIIQALMSSGLYLGKPLVEAALRAVGE